MNHYLDGMTELLINADLIDQARDHLVKTFFILEVTKLD